MGCWMAKRIPVDESNCPLREPLAKWWRGQVRRNVAAAREAGKPIRTGFFVTEEQVNRRLKLLDPAQLQPGTIAEKLESCGLKVVKQAGSPETGLLLGWKGIL